MADVLIKHLKKKTSKHSALESLYSQWNFDKKLIPKALQTIGTLFPHYSRHDESHSKQILVNIERLLGKNLKLLTATDTWLLLEAAYWHDIGMVVPHKDLQEAIADQEFQDYLHTIKSQPGHELHSLACALASKSHPTLIFESNSPLEMLSKLRELMAEWFRKKHPSRAEKIVSEPHITVGISSPRTELIPARLFKLLGRICQMHGASFEDLISEEGLPFREAGLAQDDCHPRFVACLLRMGDLLDLDDNRFCPVMQKIAGEDRSRLSKAHEDKHSGMRHLRIDQEKIEITAECETVDGYLEAFRWFDWLKKELQDQMANWRNIVPNRRLGLLPMLGPLSVRLGGKLQILKEGERPSFSIDANQAMELLQGNNLYDSKFACVRELLQNAVDATLLRIWLINRHRHDPSVWLKPNNEKLKDYFSEIFISVDLSQSDTLKNRKDRKTTWTLTITDEGTGISKDDLEHMLSIGGSKNNKYRQLEISKMPEWMKPAGTFGIGLQSAFMLCNKISITTKSLLTNEIFDITMYSPTGPEEGMVLLRQIENDISTPYGTTFKIEFELDLFAYSWSHTFDRKSISAQIINRMDPVLDESFPYEAARLADEVTNFSKHSLIPVRGTMATAEGNFDIGNSDIDNELNMEEEEWRFIKTGSVEAKILYHPDLDVHPSNSLTTYYRGQKFEAKNIYFPNVIISIDIMSGKAGEWLSFNRDKASSRAREKIKDAILDCLAKTVELDLENPGECKLLSNVQSRAIFSMFLKSMATMYSKEWILLSDKLGDAWLDCEASPYGPSYRELFSRQHFTIAIRELQDSSSQNNYDLVLQPTSYTYQFKSLVSTWTSTPGNSIKVVGSNKIYEKKSEFCGPDTFATKNKRERIVDAALENHYLFKKEPQELWDDAALATSLHKAMTRPFGNRRYLLCAGGKFPNLILKPGSKFRAISLFPTLKNNDNYILLPFLFLGNKRSNGLLVDSSPDKLYALCDIVKSELLTPYTIDEIKFFYQEVIEYIDNQVMMNTTYWPAWELGRGLKTN